MKVSLFLASVLLVCAALAGAACTSTIPSASPGLSSPVTLNSAVLSVPLSSLALTPEDVPAGYVLTESRAKNSSEVGSLAISLGWQEGWVVGYTNSTGGFLNTSGIVQTITLYPKSNIPGIIGVISRQEQSDKDITFTEIAAPGIGDTSGGYVGRAHSGMVIKQDDAGSPFSSSLVSGGSLHTEFKQDVAEVYFARDGILEVIRVTGPGADAATVTGLARNAAARIP
jgi:hypothetical protein